MHFGMKKDLWNASPDRNISERCTLLRHCNFEEICWRTNSTNNVRDLRFLSGLPDRFFSLLWSQQKEMWSLNWVWTVLEETTDCSEK